MLATEMRRSSRSVIPRPTIIRPPTPLTSRTRGSTAGSGSQPATALALRAMPPWKRSTTSAEASTPKPKVAASAIDEIPSRVALSSSSEASPTRPFCRLPTIVIGPTQNSSEAATKPSVKRPCPRTRRFRASPRPSSRSPSRQASPSAAPAASATSPSTTPGGAATRPRSAAAVMPITSVTSPIACSSTAPMRLGRRPRRARPTPEPSNTVSVLTSVPDSASNGLKRRPRAWRRPADCAAPAA